MGRSRSVWTTLVYVFIGIIAIAIALRVLSLIFNLALHLAWIFFSLVFVVGLIYVVYVVFRAAFTGK